MKSSIITSKKSILLSKLNNWQKKQIWQQIKYHHDAPMLEKITLKDDCLSFKIIDGVTRPMSSKELAIWLCANRKILNGRNVLDMGTGCGIQGIVAIKAGAYWCDMVDITSEAIQCATENIVTHGVHSKCKIHKGNLFDSIPGCHQYDVIVFAQPYFSDTPLDEYRCTIGMLDPGFLIRSFFDQATRYLSPNGFVVMLSWDFAGPINDPKVIGPLYGWVVEKTEPIVSSGIQTGLCEVVVLKVKQ